MSIAPAQAPDHRQDDLEATDAPGAGASLDERDGLRLVQVGARTDARARPQDGNPSFVTLNST